MTSWQLRDGRGIGHPDRLALQVISVFLKGMKITVELPDDLALRPDPGREALEALAIEGYRSAALTHYQARRLLQMSRFDFDALLKTRHVEDHAYDVEDLARDLATLERSRSHVSAVIVVADTPAFNDSFWYWADAALLPAFRRFRRHQPMMTVCGHFHGPPGSHIAPNGCCF